MSTANQTATATRKRKPKAIAVMETVICHICGNIVPKDDSLEFDGKNLCSHCCDMETFICDRCSKRAWNGDNAGDYENQLCQKCYDGYYTR